MPSTLTGGTTVTPKPCVCAELGEQLHVARALGAEGEVVADDDAAGAERRRPARRARTPRPSAPAKARSNGSTTVASMPSAAMQLELARERRDERRRVGRRQHLGRMRLERQHDRLAVEPGGQPRACWKMCACPRCTPSKLPIATTGLRRRRASDVWPRNVSMYVAAAAIEMGRSSAASSAPVVTCAETAVNRGAVRQCLRVRRSWATMATVPPRSRLGAVVFVAAFALFAACAAPGLYLRDSGELTTAAFTLGVAHPTGFALWCLLRQGGDARAARRGGDARAASSRRSAARPRRGWPIARCARSRPTEPAAAAGRRRARRRSSAPGLTFFRASTVPEVYAPTAAALAPSPCSCVARARAAIGAPASCWRSLGGLSLGLHAHVRLLVGPAAIVVALVRLRRGDRWPLVATVGAGARRRRRRLSAAARRARAGGQLERSAHARRRRSRTCRRRASATPSPARCSTASARTSPPSRGSTRRSSACRRSCARSAASSGCCASPRAPPARRRARRGARRRRALLGGDQPDGARRSAGRPSDRARRSPSRPAPACSPLARRLGRAPRRGPPAPWPCSCACRPRSPTSTTSSASPTRRRAGRAPRSPRRRRARACSSSRTISPPARTYEQYVAGARPDVTVLVRQHAWDKTRGGGAPAPRRRRASPTSARRVLWEPGLDPLPSPIVPDVPLYRLLPTRRRRAPSPSLPPARPLAERIAAAPAAGARSDGARRSSAARSSRSAASICRAATPPAPTRSSRPRCAVRPGDAAAAVDLAVVRARGGDVRRRAGARRRRARARSRSAGRAPQRRPLSPASSATSTAPRATSAPRTRRRRRRRAARRPGARRRRARRSPGRARRLCSSRRDADRRRPRACALCARSSTDEAIRCLSWRSFAAGCGHAHEAEVVSAVEPRATIGQPFTADTTRLVPARATADRRATASRRWPSSSTASSPPSASCAPTSRRATPTARHARARRRSAGAGLGPARAPVAEAGADVSRHARAHRHAPNEHAGRRRAVERAGRVRRRCAAARRRCSRRSCRRWTRRASRACAREATEAARAKGAIRSLTPSEYVRVPRPISARGPSIAPYYAPRGRSASGML